MTEQYPRPPSGMSMLRAPTAVRRPPAVTGTLPTARRLPTSTTSAGPSRSIGPGTTAPRNVSASRVAGAGLASSTARKAANGGAGVTIPRVPMGNATNRVAAVGRGTSGLPPPKGKVVVGSAAANRRIVSGGTRRLSNGGRRSDGGRMDAIESRMTSMQDLFELERKRTEDLLSQERAERSAQEEKVRQLEEDLLEQRRLARERTDEVSRRRTIADDELHELETKFARERRSLEEQLEMERQTVSTLKATLSQQSTAHLTMESTNAALRTQVSSLQDEIVKLTSRIAGLDETHAALKASNAHLESELREAESLRRKLHNEVQELRGNIRVFARVRPSVRNDELHGATAALATIRYPNEREAAEIELLASGESATGTATMRNHLFKFDRIFQPSATQADVFEEVAHLTQSVLDGYNTCIFAYGQTGSGKTHTLEGGVDLSLSANSDPSSDPQAGLIPRAVQMLWKTAEDLKDKGWRYDFEGQMLEIYNENINDLLGKGDEGTKHEIKHEKGRTTVTDTVVAPLDSPARVFSLLAKAKSRRQVAATLMNERSSRSHSVFIVRVRGQNATTMESCDATLSLVDLAGSERLSNSGSGADPARLKEAQCINKSLSGLADVIAALGANKPGGHVPYRNTTLTWLLKNSLGGNSKTLMLLALSPMAEHLSESLCSLRFASKVNSTVIGTARRVRASE